MEQREKSLGWWNSLYFEDKFYKVIPWLKSKGMKADDRHPDNLTGREIQEVYKHYLKSKE